MRIRQLLTDDDAVSPVIGVILMVAITVILAAVIGAFVLGFGGGGPSAPTTSWDSEEINSSGGVEFTLTQTGSEIEDGTLRFSGGNTTSPSPPIEVGQSVEVNRANSDDSVSIVWTKDGSSSTLYTHDG